MIYNVKLGDKTVMKMIANNMGEVFDLLCVQCPKAVKSRMLRIEEGL